MPHQDPVFERLEAMPPHRLRALLRIAKDAVQTSGGQVIYRDAWGHAVKRPVWVRRIVRRGASPFFGDPRSMIAQRELAARRLDGKPEGSKT